MSIRTKVALVIALGAGFPLGAYLAVALGVGFALDSGIASIIQTHGHVQLVGWVGLFIMGRSPHCAAAVVRVDSLADGGRTWPT